MPRCRADTELACHLIFRQLLQLEQDKGLRQIAVEALEHLIEQLQANTRSLASSCAEPGAACISMSASN